MDKDIKEVLWPHKTSGYLGAFVFMRISIFELECFEKKCPKIKVSALSETGFSALFWFFWKMPKFNNNCNTKSIWSTVNHRISMERIVQRMNEKKIVQIFHLVPIGCLCDHWFGHSNALENRPTLKHAGN